MCVVSLYYAEPFTFLQLELWSARANDRWLVIARL